MPTFLLPQFPYPVILVLSTFTLPLLWQSPQTFSLTLLNFYPVCQTTPGKIPLPEGFPTFPFSDEEHTFVSAVCIQEEVHAPLPCTFSYLIPQYTHPPAGYVLYYWIQALPLSPDEEETLHRYVGINIFHTATAFHLIGKGMV